ncbi:hypothetical protein D3OALGA1CA_2207 [Olavius algarvensis associated proteobacterium Delta 3]|nr:hypothetical protein D3OALGA1CA_2207 [Olavius algarvensis associated proteobacterium Delta 3]
MPGNRFLFSRDPLKNSARPSIAIARIAFRFLLRSTYHRKVAEVAEVMFLFAFR